MRLFRQNEDRRRVASARPTKPRKALSGLVLTVVASTLVVLAVQADGTPISDVDLNDGSVWVTNTDPTRQLLGRLNPQIHQLDLGIPASSGDFDVFQEGSSVFLDIRSGGRSLRRIDVAAGRASDPIELTTTTVAAVAGGTVALVDTETGNAWIRSTETIQGFTPDLAPDLTVGRGGAVAVGEDGTAWFVSQKQHNVRPAHLDGGVPTLGDATDLGGALSATLQVSAVGDKPIVLDRESATVFRPGADPVQVPTDAPLSVRLQQTGPASDTFYLATPTALLSGKTAGGELMTLQEGFNGPPAAPLVHDGYVHAAWADPNTDAYVRIKDGETHAEKIPGVASNAHLVFRRNRGVVVLNDVVSGASWLVQEEGLPRVDNWDDVDPNVRKEQEDDPLLQEEENKDCTDANRTPIARNDEVGARPGQESILPLISNDADPDPCDILTISSLEDIKWLGGPEPQRMAIVGQGTQLQVQFGPNDTGEARFSYVATDGREGGTDEAEVKVTLVPADQNRPPHLVTDSGTPRQTEVTLAKGQRTTIYALPDWTDDDGDSVILQQAEVKSGGQVTFRPDGVIEFTDDGTVGDKTVDITLSDGHAEAANGLASGKITVHVTANAGTPPALLPDHVVGQAGSWILIKPLANDFSRDGSELHLRDVPAVGGIDIKQDPASGTFQVRTSQPDTYYLDYAAYTDRAEARSFVRLDVLAKSDTNLDPVATKPGCTDDLGSRSGVSVP